MKTLPAVKAGDSGIVFVTVYHPLFFLADLDRRKEQTKFIPGGGGGLGVCPCVCVCACVHVCALYMFMCMRKCVCSCVYVGECAKNYPPSSPSSLRPPL